jgi:hypothetical protein
MTSGVDLLDRIDAHRLRVRRLSQALARITGSPKRPSPRTRYNLACHLATSDERRCVEILGDDSRREPHPWASEDPVLAGLRAGPLASTMRAALRRGRPEDPPGTLSRLDSIGIAGAEQLNRAGIYSPADLLGAAGPKESRARLAKRMSRDDPQLKEWAIVAELAIALERATPTSGQPPPLDVANLLALAGIASCTALGSVASSGVKSLADRLTRLNRAQAIVEGSKAAGHLHAITQSVVEDWIAAARANGPTRVEPPDPAVPGTPKPERMALQDMPLRGAEAGESE